jgi:pimeloyl-ACP methyl ester carboxylesterase
MHPEILRAADVIASEIYGCEQKMIIADAGHVPTFEKPEAVNAKLLQFLSKDG